MHFTYENIRMVRTKKFNLDPMGPEMYPDRGACVHLWPIRSVSRPFEVRSDFCMVPFGPGAHCEVPGDTCAFVALNPAAAAVRANYGQSLSPKSKIEIKSCDLTTHEGENRPFPAFLAALPLPPSLLLQLCCSLTWPALCRLIWFIMMS